MVRRRASAVSNHRPGGRPMSRNRGQNVPLLLQQFHFIFSAKGRLILYPFRARGSPPLPITRRRLQLKDIVMSSFRRDYITKPIFSLARSALPPMSDTEREALEAGDVWWDGELFGGDPDWSKLQNYPQAVL